MKKAKELSKYAVIISAVLGGFSAFRDFIPFCVFWIRIIGFIVFGLLLIITIIFIINSIKQKQGISDIDGESPESFKQFGITGIYEEETCDYSKVIDKVLKSKESVKIIAYYGDRLLNNYKTNLIKAINKGVNVQMLIAEKGSVLLDEVSELENNIKIKNDRQNLIGTIIEEIKNHTTNAEGSFDLGKYNTQVRYAATIIDNRWAWWTPYHAGIDVGKTISFELERGGKPFIRLCTKHFDLLWKKCKEGKHNAN
jgi:hypothetical protein